jgi:peptidoglycan-associated lipoprotein
MMRERYLSVAALGVVVTLAASGCHKNVPQVAAAQPAPAPAAAPTPPPPPAPPPPPPRPVPTPAPLTEDEIFQRKTLDQLNAERPLTDVFFDYNMSEVRVDAREPLQVNADWMKKWTGTQIMLEGHADSRGSAEYNLALGTRRANSVRDYLVSLGVPTTRITIVSKGKEAPFCTEETEVCWQQNRRGHFVITGK